MELSGARVARESAPPVMTATRVLIVEDHPLMCLGIRKALNASGDIVVVGEAHDGASALTMIGELAPDVVLLDFTLPDADAVSVMRDARQRGWHPAVIVLTCRMDEQCVRSAIDGGAVGFLTKTSVDASSLSNAVRDARLGGSVVSPDAMSSLVSAARHSGGDGPDHLTQREVEIWHLVAAGLSNREIATRLCLSERTVKFHVGNLLHKTGTRSRSEATALAYRQGIMDGYA